MNPLVRLLYALAGLVVLWFAIYWYLPRSDTQAVWVNVLFFVLFGWLALVCFVAAAGGIWWRHDR